MRRQPRAPRERHWGEGNGAYRCLRRPPRNKCGPVAKEHRRMRQAPRRTRAPTTAPTRTIRVQERHASIRSGSDAPHPSRGPRCSTRRARLFPQARGGALLATQWRRHCHHRRRTRRRRPQERPTDSSRRQRARDAAVRVHQRGGSGVPPRLATCKIPRRNSRCDSGSSPGSNRRPRTGGMCSGIRASGTHCIKPPFAPCPAQ
mmetsp:Transcript_87497/g.245691  ORF Transcript_87497/g.245691 Transcript_87497/m.245691 type:complete len:203 (+) Transcript_87497:563-1171(+)